MSQADLAAAADVDERTLRGIERGGSYQHAKLGKICTALKLSVTDLKAQAAALKKAQGPAATSGGDRWDSAIDALGRELDDIDQGIEAAHGGLLSPTRADERVEFSSRRLVASLSALDIPLDVILLILRQLPHQLQEIVGEQAVFSTAHIRTAVSRSISALSGAVIQSTETFKLRQKIGSGGGAHQAAIDQVKFDWTSRYARRYGNPDQVIQILERTGNVRRLDYAFLKTELIPHAIRWMLQEDVSLQDHPIITSSVISDMAQTVLEELRRLGLYTISYKTAICLVADLALHPPHPWIVTPQTRLQTVSYDMDRAMASLAYLQSPTARDPFDVSHRFSEVIHHLCSATLALYGGFLGHRDTSSLNLLKLWLSIEDNNPVLWKSCELQLMSGDLVAIGVSRQDFDGLLKRLDATHHASRITPAAELAVSANRLATIVGSLIRQREQSLAVEDKLQQGAALTTDEFAGLARDLLISYLGARKPRDLHAQQSDARIGLTARLRVEESILRGQSGLTVIVFCLDPDDGTEWERAVANVLDQLDAHRLSNVGLILTPRPASPHCRQALARQTERSSVFVATVSLAELASGIKEKRAASDLLDDLFTG